MRNTSFRRWYLSSFALVGALAGCSASSDVSRDSPSCDAGLTKGSSSPTPCFYVPPPHLAAYRRGDLIRWERMHLAGEMDTGLRAYRVMYWSVGAAGGPVAITGVIGVPDSAALSDQPAQPYDVVAWVHGTDGIGDTCAPSQYGTLTSASDYNDYGVLFNNIVAKWGYVGVAPDLEGIGVPGDASWVDAAAMGNATVDGVIAAHDLARAVRGPGQFSLTNRYATIGHSAGCAGAGAALEVPLPPRGASLAAVGSIELGFGGADWRQRFSDLIADPTTKLDRWTWPFLVYFGITMKLTHPGFNMANYLGDIPLQHVDAIRTQCYDQLTNEVALSVPNGEIEVRDFFRSGFLNDPVVGYFIDHYSPGFARARAPKLIIQTSNDPEHINYLSQYVRKVCGQGSAIAKISIYSEGNHDNLTSISVEEQRAYLAERFAGTASPNVCP